MNSKTIAFSVVLILLSNVGISGTAWADMPSASGVQLNHNYTFLYFENGYPTRLSKYRRPQSEANTFARENPDLVVQTGYYSLKLDCDDMRLTGYDAVQGSDYITALNQDVNVFTPADLRLQIKKDGISYRCTSAIVQDQEDQYVRLIESGQYVQRFDHLGLVFTASNGEILEKIGRLEITAWPDHVVFSLDMSDVPGVTKTSIRLTSPTGKTFQSVEMSDRAHLAIQPHLDQQYAALNTPSHVIEASDKKTGKLLSCSFDKDEYGLRIDLPIERVAFPADKDRVDEFVLEVVNPGEQARDIPFIFNEIKPQAITGTCMILCEDIDGRPTGIPIQISKNWHQDPEKRTVHEGPWLRGYTVIPLAPGETRRLRLRLVYGYWADVAAVSHAQLSVIGYGGNWKWDESALGCWGESMTYDPSLHLGSAFIDDVRPAFTVNKSGSGTHGWTENVGGGDFLIYHDSNDRFRWAKRLKTAYHWTGPNMTEVLYSGVTDDDKIRFNYRIRSVRTNDYHRRFHAWRYDFVEDIVAPKRLVFYQMAADFYRTVDFEQLHLGDRNGLQSTHIRKHGVNGYSGTTIPFDHSWIAIDDMTCSEGAAVRARRGLLSLSSSLNGLPSPNFMHLYGASRGRETMLLDLSSDSVSRSYSAGDVIQGELEFILPPKSVDEYWGSDHEFVGRLQSYGDNAWEAVADEYRHNAQVSVTIHKGTLLNNYPVEIRAAKQSSSALADFTIDHGGIGHVPVILREVPQGSALRVEQYLDGAWVPLEGVAPDQHNYYQAVRNSNGTMDYVYNIKRPSIDLNSSWRIRIVAGK